MCGPEPAVHVTKHLSLAGNFVRTTVLKPRGVFLERALGISNIIQALLLQPK